VLIGQAGKGTPYIRHVQKKSSDFCQSHEWKEEQTRTDENFAALFLFYLIYNNVEYIVINYAMQNKQNWYINVRTPK
jgi:hypothetical protein